MTRCGYIAVVGRPNVGKSTLVNNLLGQKLAITSHRPQTTRHNLMGILTEDSIQMIFMDTPGIHRSAHRVINRRMNSAAIQAIGSVQVVLMVSEGTQWGKPEERILEHRREGVPWLLALNKMDLVSDKSLLLPHLQRLGELGVFDEVVPISARKKHGLDVLKQQLCTYLPESPHHFEQDTWTDRSEQFFASEIVREQLMRQLGQELPYACVTEVEQYVQHENGRREVHIAIRVERDTQKAIVIGRGGKRIQSIGTLARKQMQITFDGPVELRLFVRTTPGWQDNPALLDELGYSG